MAASPSKPETRSCAICAASFVVNPKYSASQKQRARYCSRSCAAKGQPHNRVDMLELLGGRTRFAKLEFVAETEPQGSFRRGLFRCDCGKEKPMAIHKILRGSVISCGCESARRAASRFTKHGGYRTPEYKTWNGMMQRCHNPNDSSFPQYGARGISVCADWHGPAGFHRFVAYVGKRPSGHSIDRIDNDKGYEPGNVRWASSKDQQNNRRCSIMLTHDGLTMNPQDWAMRLGFSKNTVAMRLAAGWSVERALTTPRRLACRVERTAA